MDSSLFSEDHRGPSFSGFSNRLDVPALNLKSVSKSGQPKIGENQLIVTDRNVLFIRKTFKKIVSWLENLEEPVLGPA